MKEKSNNRDIHNLPEDSPSGCLFVDPTTLPGEYKPAKAVYLRQASEYAKRIRREEGRDVTQEELQQFVVR